MVLPSEEEGVLAGLKPKNIPIKRLTINPEKVRDRLVASLVRDPSLVIPLMGITLTFSVLAVSVRHKSARCNRELTWCTTMCWSLMSADETSSHHRYSQCEPTKPGGALEVVLSPSISVKLFLCHY